MDPSDQLKAQRLDMFLRRWTQRHPNWARSDPHGIGPLRSAEVLGRNPPIRG